jgi:hypothetical protein
MSIFISDVIAHGISGDGWTLDEPHSTFTDSISTPNFGYDINYTDDSGSCVPGNTRDDFFPQAQAQVIADAINNNDPNIQGTPNGFHNGFIDLGFKEPSFTSSFEVKIYDCAGRNTQLTVNDEKDCDSGSAEHRHIFMPSTTYCTQSEVDIRKVVGHELFHHVEFAYIGFSGWINWGRTPVEGSARMMEDHVYFDLENHWRYLNQVQLYLNNPNQDFWDASYSAALGWKYAAEQYGQMATEPSIGVDFVRSFWENAEENNSSPNTPATFEQTIKEFDNDSSLSEWFHNFSIANIAKEFDVSGLIDASKYQYIDENDGTGVTYSNVARAVVGVPPMSGTEVSNWVTVDGEDVNQGSDLRSWGSKYYEARNLITNCARGSVVAFRGQSWNDDSSNKISYGLLAIKNEGLGDFVSDLRKSQTNDFSRAYIQPLDQNVTPYTKLIVSMAGGNEDTDYKYTFDCGQPKLSLLRPNSSFQSYVGENTDPDSFIIRLLVEGPSSLGVPTVLGLQSSDFRVFVGNPSDPSNEAQVLSGANVMGEYWLTTKAPIKTSNGSYPITVFFGDGLSAAEENAVKYEKLTMDQLLVIDTSGSMAYPTDAPKMVAAKNAASMFADTVNSDGRIGMIDFNGDGTENNDDATLNSMLKDGTDAHKSSVKSDISSLPDLPADNQMTSIGDGLEAARTEFMVRGSTIGEDWVILLSDGMENEDHFWNNIQNNIINAGIKVNAIALGPNTDQFLLQEIADKTGGEYYYVDPGSFGSSLTSAFSSTQSLSAPVNNEASVTPFTNTFNSSIASYQISTDLADAYASSSEVIKRHERIWEVESNTINSSSHSHDIKVSEGGIGESTLIVSWNGTSTFANFELTDPSGNLVTDTVTTPINFGSNHVVYHLPSLSLGTWNLSLDSTDGDIVYKSILAGKNNQGATLKLIIDQNKDHSQRLIEGYLRGLPVRLFATIADDQTMVSDGYVEATITHPSGAIDVIPLYDDGGHGDGNPNDGIYSNEYARTTRGSETGLPDATGKQVGSGESGSYKVSVRASGRDSSGNEFNRIKKTSFQVLSDANNQEADTDGDGMPNRYEDLHHCLNKFINDSNTDFDGDGLVNQQEWSLGTKPCDADTDNGGENDGSEIGRNSNPFNSYDDAIGQIVEAEVIKWRLDHVPFPDSISFRPNEHVIRFSRPEGADGVQLFTSINKNGPFTYHSTYTNNQLNNQGGVIYHSGNNGDRKYYRLAGYAGAIISQAQQTYTIMGQKSHVFHGTFKVDNLAPFGGVIINDGSRYTDSQTITLNINGSSDVIEMRFSDTLSQLKNESWISYNQEVITTSSHDHSPSNPSEQDLNIYVQLRDSDNNVSDILSSNIIVKGTNELHTVTGTVSYVDQGATCPDWFFVRILGSNDLQPKLVSGSCSFSIGNITEGAHEIEISGADVQTTKTASIYINQDENIGNVELEIFDEETAPIGGYLFAPTLLTILYLISFIRRKKLGPKTF